MKIHNSCLIILFCGFQLAAFAQSPPKAFSDIKKLSKGADVILTGKVSNLKSNWNKNKTRILTEATLQVDEYIKGNSGSNSIVVKYPGGEVGDVGELYTHMPRFSKDEEVLVFLKKDEKEKSFKVYEGEDGKISVIKDAKSGEKVTSSNVKISDLKVQIKNLLKEQ